MTTYLIIAICCVQLITVYLDNKCNMYDFFANCSKGSIASAYTNRGILLTISRTIFFVVPPLLGYLITSINLAECFLLMLFAAVINMLVTIYQGYNYHQEMKLRFFDLEIIANTFKSIPAWIGIFAFAFFLITPYLLNYLALIFTQDSLWIVQLNNILNSFLTLYVIFIFEPMVAKHIDNKGNIDRYFQEAFWVRCIGRIGTFVALLCYILFF